MELDEINGRKFLAKGKRGEVYTAVFNSKKVAVKIKRKESLALSRIDIESKFLQLLNKYGIGPRYVGSGRDFVVYEFVEGAFIPDYLDKASREDILIVLRKIFAQLYVMDRLGINKEEMHHPVKHIIIDKEPVMIDFERCRFTEKPHNVTQFCQFLASSNLRPALQKKDISVDPSIRKLASAYAESMSEENYKNILGAVMNAY